MNLLWTDRGWGDYLHWQQTDPDMLRRINGLIRDVQRMPFSGVGKPEPLGGDLRGWWSRRVTVEHRLVYRLIGSGNEQRIEIASCRYHYSRRR
jgi:toxin YoeB